MNLAREEVAFSAPGESARASWRFQAALVLALVVFGAAMRVVPHPWNLAPVGAIALFAGARLASKRLALVVPLAVMVVSDAVLGFHAGVLFSYPCYMLIAVLGIAIRSQRGPWPVLCGSVLASQLFFVVTNFGAWVLSHGKDAYPKTWAGLVDCFVMGLPFYRNTLAGDVLFSALLFGLYALAVHGWPRVAGRLAPSTATYAKR